MAFTSAMIPQVPVWRPMGVLWLMLAAVASHGLLQVLNLPTLLVDAEKESLQADKILLPLAAIRAGKGYLTEQGSAENAFDF